MGLFLPWFFFTRFIFRDTNGYVRRISFDDVSAVDAAAYLRYVFVYRFRPVKWYLQLTWWIPTLYLNRFRCVFLSCHRNARSAVEYDGHSQLPRRDLSATLAVVVSHAHHIIIFSVFSPLLYGLWYDVGESAPVLLK